MKFLKKLMQSAGLGILCVTLIFGALGCNFDSTVQLAASLATNFLNSCGAFGLNPADQAICNAAAVAIKGLADEAVVTHDAWVAAKGNGTLAAFKAAISAAVTKIPDILASLHLSGGINLVTLAIRLILSTIQIIASGLGIASAQLTARAPRIIAGNQVREGH